MRTIVFLGDTQYPAIHDAAWDGVLNALAVWDLDEVWFLGDGIDFPMLTTKFPIDPSVRHDLQADLDGWDKRLGELVTVTELRGARRWVYLLGNHEDRLQKYLWHQAPELSGVRGLEIGSLLPTLTWAWETHPWHELVPVTDYFFATHGESVSSYAGATAKKMIDRTAVCGIMGHTHRLGSSVRRVVKPGGGYRYLGWWENGCLADDRKMTWTKGNEDWQLGFSLGYFDGDAFAIEQVFVHEDGKLMRGGVWYGK